MERYTVSLKDKDFSKMDISFIFCLALILCFTFSIQGEKRIILNDPDVVAERLNRIEQKVTTLETDNLQQKQTVAFLKTENLQQKQNMTKLETDNLQQKQRVNILETDSLQQKQTMTNLKAENLQLKQRLQQVLNGNLPANSESAIVSFKLQSMYYNSMIIR